MIEDRIGNIFDFIPETNLTEEYFYNHKGQYPVYSGQTKAEGIIAHIDSYNQNQPCITFTTYGINAGTMFYREGEYTLGRNCMGLRPREKYKNRINLRWFSYKYQNLFRRLRIGDLKGQRSLNKTLLEDSQIIIPDVEVQEVQLKAYTKPQFFIDKIKQLRSKSASLLKSNMQVTNFVHHERISELFHIKGGNSGLTEKFIYCNSPKNVDEGIPILSSATIKANLMGYISRNAKPNGKKLKTFNGPCILIARNGYAGTMTYITEKEFTTNDHAYVLFPKKAWKDRINLKWFMYQYQELFYNVVTSKSDNATFGKEYAENQEVKLPNIDFQNDVGEKLLKLDETLEKLRRLEEQLEDLIEYEII